MKLGVLRIVGFFSSSRLAAILFMMLNPGSCGSVDLWLRLATDSTAK
jgi:hypothetical protein